MCIKTTLMKFLLGLCILHFGHLVLAQGVLDADGCDPNPCLHSGSCSIDPVMNYTCSCQLGYVGRNCEISEFSTTSSETITDIGEVSTTVGVNTTTNVTYSSSGASTTFTTTTPSTDTLPWYSTIYDTTTYPTGVSTETPLGTGVSTETPLGSHGAPCTRTQDCMAGDNNTVCTDTGQCTCNTGLPPYYLDGANLCAPYYNAECSKNTSCLPQITSYYCNDINRCVCGFGLIYNQEMQRCIYGYNQECYSELGCGDSSLVCTGLLLDNTPGSCKCAPGHNFLRGRCRAGE
ncbi:slit homolog 1 protein [Lingula anatina]|uniref:Slit homolog 1 protein n=1 Tax=Lingula anatina TaxID=7574 RepID=A0A1S3HEC3_LINAN|nr:slit homolog 1 protein [Lingula anatina]|eukprot:XP_013384422.1 slit homolog 1 protein [Lingula anatina]